MALLAALVIFTVIARYCFSLSWKQLAEFNTTLFAFTTFWGMGINVIKDEHVMIDIIYDGVKPARKRWLAIVNYLIVLAVDLVFTYQGFKYVGVAGKQISQGMEIPMMYMYGIMPVCGIICAICVVIKIITLYKADISLRERRENTYGNAHPSGAADLLCCAGRAAGLCNRRFLRELYSDLRTQLYHHAAAARMERRLQRADDSHAAVHAGR